MAQQIAENLAEALEPHASIDDRQTCTAYNQSVLFYDAQCPMCVQLAHWVERRSASTITIAPLSDLQSMSEQAPQKDIALMHNQKLHHGAAAWEILLNLHPDLKFLAWVAARLGWTAPLASTLRVGSRAIKSFCIRCRNRLF